MSLAITASYSQDLDTFLEAYETAQAEHGPANLADFLPAGDHPLYHLILRELVRVDMEYTWRRGEPCTQGEYLQRFPALADDPQGLAEIGFEEERLRAQLAQRPAEALEPGWGAQEAPLGFLSQFLDRDAPQLRARWLEATDASPAAHMGTGTALERAARSFQSVCKQDDAPTAVRQWLASVGSENPHARLLHDLHRSDPAAADRLAEAAVRMPPVGSTFLDFRLVAKLGEGAFARVYLAEQPELANRLVALKVATDLNGEPKRLAQLQHTNIMPVWSVHRAGPFQAICMPYFGSMTLADLLRDLDGCASMPNSGKAVVSTLRERRQATMREKSRASGEVRRASMLQHSQASHAEPGPGTTESAELRAALQAVEGQTYVQAILALAVRIADGLAHAHERGIFHRDLKPANILLTDDGQPMLLDFNLAEDTKLGVEAACASIGGTLPYMAPEHLEAFQGLPRVVDGRSDIYALGVILYELLTGRLPFPSQSGTTDEAIPLYLRDRTGPPPPLRCWNLALSPAVEAIIRHCLEPSPQRRYQTARQLREDLERHLQDLPLKHAVEPSWRERLGKFQRRHPRLTSSFSVGAAASVLLLALTLAFVGRGQRLARLEALDTRQQFQEQMKSVQFLLNVQTGDRTDLQTGLDECRQTLGRYRVLEHPAWREQPAVRLLPEPERVQLEQEVGELLLLLARGTEPIQLALNLNERAAALYAAEDTPRALWLQRAALYERLGQTDEARQLRARAADVPLRNARDHYLLAAEHAVHGRFQEALPLLREATQLDPQNYWAWFLRGWCHDGLAHDTQAEACYSTCIALGPKSYWPYYNRGVVYLRQQDHRQALADFDRTIQLRPEMADAYVNRALAWQGLRRLAEAEEDLSQALERGTIPTRVYFMRARVRELAGDKEGALRDRQEGLRREPADEKSWIARGVARVATNVVGALADFDEALTLNPRSRAALQSKAYVLAERLNRPREAVEVLDQATGFYPDSAALVAARGVLQARLGQRQAAHADADEALQRDRQPATQYQVAGIYALTSKFNPDDRRQAFELLSAALRKGYGFDLLDQDHDLDPIRTEPEFQRLVTAARALAPGPR